MTTSTVSPELLRGFLTEAQDYVDSLRECLAKEDGRDDPEFLQEIQRQVSILRGGAEALDLEGVTELANPIAEMLKALIEADATLGDEEDRKLAATLDQIEAHLHTLLGEDDETREDDQGADGGLPADLPADLVEVFVLEAQEHSQAIQDGLERVRQHPGDTATLSEIRRVTHTLKGAAASVGFKAMARLAHLMEDLLERRLEGEGTLSGEAVELLLDSADALEGLVGSDQVTEINALVESIETRYADLLGEAYTPPEIPGRPEPSDEGAGTWQPQRSGSMLRVAQENIDRLINRVGEIVINRAALEEHLGAFRGILTELDHSARRLRRVSYDIDAQVERVPLSRVEGRGSYDKAFDPLELDRYTLLHQYARELDEIAADTGDINNQLHFLVDDIGGALTRERRLSTELQDGLMTTRLVSFHTIETRLRRTVRRTARDLGKSVDIILTGFDTQVDKTILDVLTDPIMHLLRNAVDHGVEPPEARSAAGKSSTGLLTLNVLRERNRVVLTLSDDGAGVDLDQVRRRAISRGMLTKDEHSDTEHLLNLLFEEGFSLAETVTQTSGRGVGLGIVRRAVRELQGTVRVNTTAGRGTTFTISVPITLAITRALFVQSCGQVFAVPLEQITVLLRLQADDLEGIRTQDVLRHGGRPLSVFNLATFIQGTEVVVQDQRYGLVIEVDDQRTAVLVEGLAGTQEAVVKSLGTHLRRVHGISGATLAGDGSVVLILDLPQLVGTEPAAYHGDKPRFVTQASSDARPHALVVDDSLSVRRVVCSFLERAGWQATPAKDGIEALEKLASAQPDVALVDIEMPRMNGFELLSRIKADPALQDVPVVFLTSRSAVKHRERAAQLQVGGYLVKPYREEELLEMLTRVMQKQS